MQANRARDTRPELALRKELHRLGLRFRKHIRPIPNLRCEADVVFPRERIAIFLDGCFWHGCSRHRQRPASNQTYWDAKIESNVARDVRNNEALSVAGWEVLRYWEHQPLEEVTTSIVAAVEVKRRLARAEP